MEDIYDIDDEIEDHRSHLRRSHLLDQSNSMEHPCMTPFKMPARPSPPGLDTRTGLAAAEPETHSSLTQYRQNSLKSSPPAFTHPPGPETPRIGSSYPRHRPSRQDLQQFAPTPAPPLDKNESSERVSVHGKHAAIPPSSGAKEPYLSQLPSVVNNSSFGQATTGKHGAFQRPSEDEDDVALRQMEAFARPKQFEKCATHEQYSARNYDSDDEPIQDYRSPRPRFEEARQVSRQRSKQGSDQSSSKPSRLSHQSPQLDLNHDYDSNEHAARDHQSRQGPRSHRGSLEQDRQVSRRYSKHGDDASSSKPRRLSTKISNLDLNNDYDHQMSRQHSKQGSGQSCSGPVRLASKISNLDLNDDYDRQDRKDHDLRGQVHKDQRPRHHRASHDDAQPTRYKEHAVHARSRHHAHRDEKAGAHQPRPRSTHQPSRYIVTDEPERQETLTSSNEWETEEEYDVVPQNEEADFYRDYRPPPPTRTHGQELKYQGWVMLEAGAAMGHTTGKMVYHMAVRSKRSQSLQKTFKRNAAKINYRNAKALVTETTVSDISRAACNIVVALSKTSAGRGAMDMFVDRTYATRGGIQSEPFDETQSEPTDEGWDIINKSDPESEEIYDKSVIPSRTSRNGQAEGRPTTHTARAALNDDDHYDDDNDDHNNDGFFDRVAGGSGLGIPSN